MPSPATVTSPKVSRPNSNRSAIVHRVYRDAGDRPSAHRLFCQAEHSLHRERYRMPLSRLMDLFAQAGELSATVIAQSDRRENTCSSSARRKAIATKP